MTRDNLIAYVLSLPEATEGMHFGTRDFRVRTKIFLSVPSDGFCVVKLTPDQQQMALALGGDVTLPVPGGWGERGWTRLLHAIADDETVTSLVRQAWKNVAPRSMISRED
jgi:predicted DNA-binding protein (MmcQ/YjbR family)